MTDEEKSDLEYCKSKIEALIHQKNVQAEKIQKLEQGILAGGQISLRSPNGQHQIVLKVDDNGAGAWIVTNGEGLTVYTSSDKSPLAKFDKVTWGGHERS